MNIFAFHSSDLKSPFTMRLEYTISFQGPPSVFQFFTFRVEGNEGKFLSSAHGRGLSAPDNGVVVSCLLSQ